MIPTPARLNSTWRMHIRRRKSRCELGASGCADPVEGADSRTDGESELRSYELSFWCWSYDTVYTGNCYSRLFLCCFPEISCGTVSCRSRLFLASCKLNARFVMVFSKGWLRDDFLETALTMGKTQKGQWGMTFTSTCSLILPFVCHFFRGIFTFFPCESDCFAGHPRLAMMGELKEEKSSLVMFEIFSGFSGVINTGKHSTIGFGDVSDVIANGSDN